MQAQTASRKRPAPGTSPARQQQPAAQPVYQYPQNTSALEQYGDQLAGDSSVFPNTPFDTNIYSNNMNGVQPQTYGSNFPSQPMASNQLVRRNTNQQLASRIGGVQDQWAFNNKSNTSAQQGQVWEGTNKDEQDLDQRAAAAKKDAQAKRKQIPPFVLKLWSFLNESRNTDLIRWTDDGEAFTVLDEDEFARTLIPELFKHNNYASFVRQLNMYGFHKKVSLNANSMKASEKKQKDPNVYWHEYFREGREDLLWLIQKPLGKSAAAKRKRGEGKGDGDSEDDGRRGTPEIADGHSTGRLVQGGSGNQDLVTMPRSEVANLRHEIQRLQQQQSVISKMISSLKEQNQEFYRQAKEFQSLHDRHENSINAILTFLATFYNKSLESGFNLNNLFGSSAAQPGHVVDVGDGEFAEANTPNTQQVQRYRRPQLLLESSNSGQHLQPGNAATAPSPARSSISPAHGHRQQSRYPSSAAQSSSPRPVPGASVSPAANDDVDISSLANAFPESDEMMSLINAANANTPSNSGPNFDFPTALNHAQNASGNQPLTDQQRNDMLNLIAKQGQSQGNSALSNSQRPQMPDLEQFARTQEQLEMLQRLQREQDSKVQDLAGRLQPLSPNGSIPGLLDNTAGGYSGLGGSDLGAPGSDFDIDAFINSDDNYFPDTTNNPYAQQTDLGQGLQDLDDGNKDNTAAGAGIDAGGEDTVPDMRFDDEDPTGLNFDFGNPSNSNTIDGANAQNPSMMDLFGDDDEELDQEAASPTGGGGRIESLSSEATSPANNPSFHTPGGTASATNHADRVAGAVGGGIGYAQPHIDDEETPTKRRRRD